MLRMRDVRSSRVRLVRFFQRLPFAGTVWDKRGWQENAKDKPLLCKGFARGEESLGGNYKIGAAIVGKETFLGFDDVGAC